MSLRDEMALYTELTGEDGTKVPIIALGHFLWGYEIGVNKSRPKGKWLRHQAGLFDYHYCSICEEQAKVLQDGGGCELLSNYCPKCGAEMESE